MEVKTFTVYSGTEILNRPNGWEAVPVTLDFTSVEDKVDGVKIVKAGTPLKFEQDGQHIKATKADGEAAGGILKEDVFESRPIGTALKKAYINKKRAEEHSGVTLDDTVLEKLPMIVVE